MPPAFDHQLSRPLIHRFHCLDCIQDEIQHHLLNLDAVSDHLRKIGAWFKFWNNSVSLDLDSHQTDDTQDHFIDIQFLVHLARPLKQRSNPCNHIASPLAVADHSLHRFPGLG